MSESQTGRRPAGLALAIWGVRKCPLILLACTLGLGVALPVLLYSPDRYAADASILARDVQIPPAALASYASEIFASDALLARVADDAGTDVATVADQLSVDADEDRVEFGVRARADEPAAAAELADAAADAFAAELNKGGTGIGRFEVQGRAAEPSERSSEGLPSWAAAALGLVGGALVGILVVLVVGAIRRPLLQGRDVTSAVRRRLLGVVRLPEERADRPVDPREAHGLIPVARALLPRIGGSVVFASSERAAADRGRLLVLVAMVLSSRLDVFVSGTPPVVDAATEVLRRRGGGDGPPRPALELVDGVPPADTLDVPEWPLPVVLVVRYGEPRASLRRLAADNFDEEVLGVALVDERAPLRRRRSRDVPPPWVEPGTSAAPDSEAKPFADRGSRSG